MSDEEINEVLEDVRYYHYHTEKCDISREYHMDLLKRKVPNVTLTKLTKVEDEHVMATGDFYQDVIRKIGGTNTLYVFQSLLVSIQQGDSNKEFFFREVIKERFENFLNKKINS